MLFPSSDAICVRRKLSLHMDDPASVYTLSQAVHLQMTFTHKSLQKWYNWCFLIRLFSVGKGCSCTFLSKIFQYVKLLIFLLFEFLKNLILCQTHFYGHMLIFFLGRVIGSD